MSAVNITEIPMVNKFDPGKLFLKYLFYLEKEDIAFE